MHIDLYADLAVLLLSSTFLTEYGICGFMHNSASIGPIFRVQIINVMANGKRDVFQKYWKKNQGLVLIVTVGTTSRDDRRHTIDEGKRRSETQVHITYSTYYHSLT